MKLKNSSNTEYYSDSIIDKEASPELKKMIIELIEISENQALSIEQHKKKVDKLNKIAFDTLNDSDVNIFLAGSSVACASFEYWHTNINDWVSLIYGGDIPRLKNGLESPYDHWVLDGMTGADIGGAIAGFITGGASGAVAGGIGAAPGAALGAIAGSSSASIGKLAENVWNHYL